MSRDPNDPPFLPHRPNRSTSSSSPSSSSTRSSSSALARTMTRLLPISRKSTMERPQGDNNQFGLNIVYQPDESTTVIADFVFVHGLGGGSSTSWCIKGNPESFWPKEWLPKDPEFGGIRIYNFGYNASWGSRSKSTLDVHAFGQSLVEELLSDPKIKSSATPIVLIGHSMGGLVIKKACILSKTNPDSTRLASRFHSFYFLGTPHRGAGLAKVLGNLLRVSGTGRKPFVAGLESQSDMIRTLNDDFRVIYSGIHLHTFYESQPISPVGLIVERESAILGYAKERPQLLNANHHDLVKFENISDSNYRSLRNRLASTVQQIREEMEPDKETLEPEERPEPEEPPSLPLEAEATLAKSRTQSLPLYQTSTTYEQLEAVRSYLSLDHSPDDVLLYLNDTRLKGSCSWLSVKASFLQWRHSPAHRYFHLRGAPACGKSIMSTYIIEHLRDSGSPVCYYFFKNGEKTAPKISTFLRSMAYQMARVNPIIREALFQLVQHGPAIDIRNQKSIWHNVFTSCVFHEKLERPHFWIIDALDEGTERRSADEYLNLLDKIDSRIQLKIFITSRPTIALDNLFARLPAITELVTPDDSMNDIRLYVECLAANLPVADADERNNLVQNIVDTSGGSFLWTVLVMKKLQEALTVEEIHEVLHEVPQKMNELYQHNVKSMEASISNHEPVKHIIIWAICAVHPLTVDQMKDAIKMSQGQTLARDLRTSLQDLCGQFLDVDKQSRIQVVHETARAFLTDSGLDSKFRVDYAGGHEIIASACLRYLLGEDLKHSRWHKSSATSGESKSSMMDYACLRWSEHIARSSSSSDGLCDLLVEFFRENVLSWIERVVQLGDLDCLNRTSRHLSGFLGRRTKYAPMLSNDLNAWVVDLPRIVTQFGANLVDDPTSIHVLIPPFCPRDSAIHRHFGYAEDGIKLVGAWNSGWDDRICSISYHETYTREVSARDHRFAVGLADGLVKIYRTSTCEESLTLDHAESLSVLEFGPTAKFVASAGLRNVRLWDAATGKQILHVSLDSQTLAVAFDENEERLMVASRDKHLAVFKIVDGTLLYRLEWTDTFIKSNDSGFPPSPSGVKISIELQVMAVIYRSKPVQLWSLEKQRPIGACMRPSTHKHASAGHIVHCAVFNTSPASPGLLVTYWDDFVAVYDVKTCKTLVSTSVGLDRVAIAPNGKTVAGSDGIGGIKILDFETLQFLHRIQVQGDPVTSIVFTTDSLRIIDVRGTHANVWEPLVLVCQDSDSQSRDASESVHQTVDDIGVSVVDQSEAITSLFCCEENGIALCGRNDGRVDICNLDDPRKTMRNLYKHRGTFTSITCIGWAYKPRIAASADSSGKFRIMQVTSGTRREWSAELLAEAQLDQGHTIAQVLVHPDGSYLLVSSSESDSVWSIATKQRVATITGRKRTVWKWFIRPSNPSQLLLFEDKLLKLYDWANLAEVASAEAPVRPVQVERRASGASGYADADADAISISSEGDDLVFVEKILPHPQAIQVTSSRYPPITKIHIFDLSFLKPCPLPSTSPISQLFPPSRADTGSQSRSPPQLKNPFSTSSLNDPPPITTIPSFGSMSTRRRSSVRKVADVPDVERIVGTVKKFNSWFLIFISREGWVCSVELGEGGGKVLDTFQKHFFVPSVWRTANSSLITKIRRCQDIIFVHQDGIIVVKNGLDNGQHVFFD